VAERRPRAKRRAGEVAAEARSRRAVNWTHLGASLALATAILVMVNYLAFRHYERWDWTESSIFTLSDRTEEELRALDRNVDIYVFLSQGEPNFPEIEELLERYRAVTDRVSLHFVDPDRDPSEFRMLAQRFGISAAMMESGQTLADVAAVVTRGDAKWTITRDDLRSFDFDSFEDEDGPKVDVKAEQAFTGAIVQVTTGEATRVCVSTGHGEWSLEAGDERSLYALEQELRKDNIEMESVELVGDRSVPADCSALYVIGPVRAFGDEEAGELLAYLDRGGNLLLALDPVLERDAIQGTGLEGMAAELGVQVDSSLVLERDTSLLLPPGNPAGPFLALSYGPHPTMAALERLGGAAMVAMARRVRPVEGAGAVPLIETSEQGYAETDLAQLATDELPDPDAQDIPGPVSIAVAAQRGGDAGGGHDGHDHGGGESEGGRVVVVGDAEWLLAEAIRAPRFTNFDLAMAWTGWLTQRETLIAIQPKQIDAQPMTITEGDLGGLAGRLIGLMPAAMLLLGFAMWWSRRS